MLIFLVNYICKIANRCGDRATEKCGRWIVRIVNYLNIAQIPSSHIFDPALNSATVLEVRSAMDQPTVNGRGGWQAAARVISEKRRQAEPLLSLPRELAITILMGMEGFFTPKTIYEASAKIDEISTLYHQTGRPSYLFEIAHAEAVKLLKAADAQTGYLGAGCLSKLFATRSNTDLQLGERIREQAVLLYLQHSEEYSKFLGHDAKGNKILPSGNNFEQFAMSMLRNAYGEIPQ